MKTLLLIPCVLILPACDLLGLGTVDPVVVKEVGTGIVEVLPQLPSAIAGNPAAIINVALGVLGSLGLLWGGKKVVDKVKAAPPGKLSG